MSANIKPKKTRSPNFPTVALEKSLSQAQTLFDKYARYPIAWEVAIGSLGYTLKSSAGMQAMATLIAYGLIQVEGSGSERKVAVSDLAFKILADKRIFSPEREAAIKEAALNPSIYQKIIERFTKSLPADDALEWELVSTYKFNKASVHDFITVFRGTLDFAKVYESGIIGDENTLPEARIQELQGDKPMIQPEGARSRTNIQPIPPGALPMAEGEYEISKFFLGGNISVRIVASAPITKFTQKTIDKLIKHLQLDKEDLPVDDIEKPDDE
jgi:hypothetical protein